MKFLLSVIDTATGTGTEDEMRAIKAFNESLIEDGHWVMAAGLDAPSKAYVVQHEFQEDAIVPGPVNVTDRYAAGFWIVEAETPEIAQSIAQRAARACNRDVEVRAFL